ncbi:MAG TPA: PAS domain S-box protein, partial [Rhodocyclaceae bacterium]|nr:PAS domain S-box protein [Rhodocyclaceae bacterium]
LRILGCTREQVIGHSPADFFPRLQPEGKGSLERANEIAEQALAGRVQTLEWQYLRADGSVIDAEITMAAVGRTGNRYLLATIRDISLRKQAERKLHEYTALQTAILESANYAIIATDVVGVIRSLNRAAERLTGYRQDELVGRATPALFHDEREVEERARTLSAELGTPVLPGFEVFVAKARRGIAEEREWIYRRKDGRPVPVMLTVSAIRDASGEISGFLGIASDQSERRHAEQVSMRSDLRMRATLENTPNVAVQWFDSNGRVLYWNKASQAVYGWRAEEAVGRTLDELMQTPAEAAGFVQTLAEVARQGSCLGPLEYVVRHRDGSPRTVLSTIFPIPGEDDEPWFVSMDVDITERKEAEAGLASSRRALMEHNESLRVINQLSARLHDNLEVEAIVRETVASLHGYSRMPVFGVYLFDPSRALLQLAHSEGFDSDLAHQGETLPLVGSLSGLALMEGRLLRSVDVAEDDRIEPHVREALLARNIHYCVVIPLIHSGRPLGTINLVYNERPELGDIELETFDSIGKTVCMALANARHLDDLEYQALHDSLTGLPNRVILHRKFRQFAGEPGSTRPLAMLLLDLDRFKEINDSMGHHVGDLLLRQISARLDGMLQEHGGVLCRLGGDEFAALLPALADPVRIRALAQSLLAALRQPFVVEGMALEVDASLGIAMHPRDGADSGEMLRSADVAMYEAKRKGIGISFYDRELDQHSPERLVLIAEMNGAIREGQLCLYYQPKMDLAHDRILGFEALVRWNHPRFGLLAPDVFLASAEVGEIV